MRIHFELDIDIAHCQAVRGFDCLVEGSNYGPHNQKGKQEEHDHEGASRDCQIPQCDTVIFMCSCKSSFDLAFLIAKYVAKFLINRAEFIDRSLKGILGWRCSNWVCKFERTATSD